MTGRIDGGSALRRGVKNLNPLYRGANQTGLRAANERLVLSLVRLHGQLSKGQIADITGLTAQTASVIVRSLEADGYLLRGMPVRGKIGQPSVPMSLDPSGALFLGLRLGAGADLVLADFLGDVRTAWRLDDDAGLEAATEAAASAAADIRSGLEKEQAPRLQGLGIAMPGAMLEGIGEAGLDRLAAAFGRRLDLPVYIQDDAVAACSAELVYGLGGGIPNFLYFHIGARVGGSLVQGGQLQLADSPASPDISRMLVPLRGGRLQRLADLVPPAADGSILCETNVDALARGLAHAVQAASSVVRLDACIIDGIGPVAVRRSVAQSVKARLQTLIVDRPPFPIREGTSDRRSPALGAACLPLLSRFFWEAEVKPARPHEQTR